MGYYWRIKLTGLKLNDRSKLWFVTQIDYLINYFVKFELRFCSSKKPNQFWKHPLYSWNSILNYTNVECEVAQLLFLHSIPCSNVMCNQEQETHKSYVFVLVLSTFLHTGRVGRFDPDLVSPLRNSCHVVKVSSGKRCRNKNLPPCSPTKLGLDLK